MKFKLKATFWEFLMRCLLWFLVSVITLGLGSIWVMYDSVKWFVERIEIQKQK